ncbi:D-glycero-D-manno-heptose 1,7-bisphosphate phosphatase [Ancylobacter aquaticus]|uniref:D,D-heptose 1,7-bisphosphate phosphatase n=1 Tax=Ancylobacter aquaticus TaxID=100 RepID=A0A4R1HZS8_ANCAQ|nr:HAD-IIIA family hydrolase [Ancylobacter aquaticus]TCK28357.1 D-glycero-D-manno-heptose 1,7-bisphosphate phosphatase [Ancylobacter aquaticus]
MVSQAVILCGGIGTRLGTLTETTPKPMLEVGGRPFLLHLIQEVARHGVERITLLAGRFGDQITATFHGHRLFGAQIEVLAEPAPLGTGGALGFAVDRLDPEFLLLNGDSWIDADLTRFVLAWRRSRERDPALIAQMLPHRVADTTRFGRLVLDGDRVAAFDDKGDRRGEVSGLINAGVYIVDRRIVDLIPRHAACSLEREILPRLVREGRVVAAPVREGAYFVDIGIPETLARVREELIGIRTRPAIFFDRDGTLTRDSGYTHRVEDLHWMPQAREAIALANDRGYFVFVVTNQSGIARGLYDEAAVEMFHRAMQESLAQIGAHVDAFEWCPHHVEAAVPAYRKDCSRRKPGPGMILDLLAAWPVERRRSFLIGNGEVDMEAARASGLRAVRYEGGSMLDILTTSF